MDKIGKYRIVREIARGGMGIVYEAEDPELRRRVAVKVLKDSGDPRLVARLHREASIAAQLRHPNIVAVHEISMVEGEHFIVMDYVEGRTLAELLAARAPLEEILKLLVEVARAVADAHAKGVIHRDLKPANVIVNAEGRAVLTDFGLARAEHLHSQLTRDQSVIGTPLYMAPEQVEGRLADIGMRTDVYALGVILYEMLAGRAPFAGPTPAQIYKRILEEEPEPPSRLRPKLHPDLETICLKAMAKEPDRRYATAMDLADDLDRQLRGEPIHGTRAGRWYHARRRIARHPWAWVMSAVAVLAVSASAYFATRARPSPPSPDSREEQAKLAYAAGDLDRAESLATGYWKGRILARRYFLRRGFPGSILYQGTFVVEPWRVETDEERRLREEAAPLLGTQDPFAQGVASLWRGEYREAAERFDALSEPEALYLSGLAYFLLEDPVRASERLRRCRDADRALVRALLARAHHAVATDGRAARWFDEAFAVAERLDDRRLSAEVLVEWGSWNAGQGKSELATERFVDALRMLENRADVARGDALCGLATLSELTGPVDADLFRRAIAAYDEVLQSDPRSVTALIRRGHARARRYDLSRKTATHDPRDLELAGADFRRALDLNPNLFQAAMELASADSGLAAQSVRTVPDLIAILEREAEAYRRITERWPACTFGYSALGTSYVKLGVQRTIVGEDPTQEYNRAVELYRKAMALNPGYRGWNVGLANVLHNLIQVKMRKGVDLEAEFKEAFEAFRIGIDATPTMADGWSELGALHLTHAGYLSTRDRDPLPEFEAAVACFDRAEKCDRSFSEAYLRRAGARAGWAEWLQARGRDPGTLFADAVQDCRRAIEVRETDDQAWMLLGNLHFSAGTYGEAVRAFSRVAELRPRSFHPLLRRAESLQRLGRKEEARKDLLRAIELEPSLEPRLRPHLED